VFSLQRSGAQHMGGQDCKGIRVNQRGEVTNFVMNDKCAGGTGRFIEIIADVLKVAVRGWRALAAEHREDLLQQDLCRFLPQSGCGAHDAGLHEAISSPEASEKTWAW
jgi:activator of 2-hydroxyglutaryl-CoA dehydratase